MINNSKIRNCTVSYPPVQGLMATESLGKIRLKNLYQAWNEENITQILDRCESNPFTIRTGTPVVDQQLRNDQIYLVTHYICLLYTSPSPRDRTRSRMPSSA